MGKVYIVGAGPGDPELITLKALRILRSADAVLYDRLVSPEVLNFVRDNALLIYVGKEDGKHTVPQEEINSLLLKLSKTYRIVVRLKGGDPFVFGRGGEEAVFLEENGVEWEVVPGVSSVHSVPASAGIPLTMRGVSSSFAVVTGHEAVGKIKPVDWKVFGGIDTLVILMGVKNRRHIARSLIYAGRSPSEPVAFIERGTTEGQRIVFSTLREVAGDPPPVEPPAVMVVGEVVRVGQKLAESVAEVIRADAGIDKGSSK